MALVGAVAGMVWRSGLGILRQYADLPTERTLTRALMSANPLDNVAYQSYQAIARSLITAARVSFGMMSLGDFRPRLRDIPQDATIRSTDARLQYTVAVTVRGSEGASMRTIVRVRSDRPLTWDEVQQRIRDEMDAQQSDRRSTQRAINRLREREWVDMVLLAVGQRP